MGYYVRIITEMGCCGCFGFPRKPKTSLKIPPKANISEQLLLDEDIEDDYEYYSDSEEHLDTATRSDSEPHFFGSRIEDIVNFRKENGLICREFPVKETHVVVRTEHEDGNKMVNEYVRERKIGSGSYGKVVLYRNRNDGKYYAVKPSGLQLYRAEWWPRNQAFHKSHLLKLRVAPSETAMTDVLREVSIMKMSDHPNIVNLVEVIDDPNSDNFYMVLEYVEGKWSYDSAGPSGRLNESTARKYLRDIISGLLYLHSHNVVHGDIKPDNLLVTSTGIVKIADFSVSQVFEDDNDVLRRSPGTPVFTAPECCLGLTYHGKLADTWAVGVTLYFMVLGRYPFLGETLQDTYDKIVNCQLWLPHDMEPQLKDLLTGLLNKDPNLRLTLGSAANHGWVTAHEGPIPSYLCWCKRAKPNGIVTVKF